jgi:hypothetical protein
MIKFLSIGALLLLASCGNKPSQNSGVPSTPCLSDCETTNPDTGQTPPGVKIRYENSPNSYYTYSDNWDSEFSPGQLDSDESYFELINKDFAFSSRDSDKFSIASKLRSRIAILMKTEHSRVWMIQTEE